MCRKYATEPDSEIESVVYEPPSPEFPHLVVILTPNGVDVQTAADRTEARTIMRSIEQVLEDESAFALAAVVAFNPAI
jgi:hypothetical protein